MLTADGPKVLEFNARFGDPETQVLMPRIEGDLLEAPRGCGAGRPLGIVPRDKRRGRGHGRRSRRPSTRPAATTRAPGSTGSTRRASTGAIVFHGGTAVRDGTVVTNGGRILSVTASAPTVSAARDRAYAAVDLISFDGAQFRTDIAASAYA